MNLNDLQYSLQELYEIETQHRISDFITSNPKLKSALLASHCSSHETVFVHCENDAMDIAVFFDDEVVEQLKIDSSPGSLLSSNINNYCYVMEGISHFLYLVYNGSYDRAVTLMELELQAEVDKFIMLQALISDKNNSSEKWRLHNSVFSEISLRPGLDQSEVQRYKDANFFAGKYCRILLKDYLGKRPLSELKRQLRRFYRLTLQDKLRLINQLH